jgi:phosphoserine phosphatase
MVAENAGASEAAGDAATAEKIAQCMRMLAGETDEHKFAGLLMVTKLGDLPAEQLQQVRRQVLTTVGASFFLRLLHTKGQSFVFSRRLPMLRR